MAGNASSKQLYQGNMSSCSLACTWTKDTSDPKELKVTWGIKIHAYTEKLTTHHTTKCIRATAGTKAFALPI